MNITEVPVSDEGKGKKKKNKKTKKRKMSASEEGGGQGDGAETKEEKMERTSEAATAFPPTFSVSEIKNKQRRHLMFMKLKQEKRKVTLTMLSIVFTRGCDGERR